MKFVGFSLLGKVLVEMDKDEYNSLKIKAASVGLGVEELLLLALSKIQDFNIKRKEDIRKRLQLLRNKLEELSQPSMAISSKLAALRFKYFSTYSECASQSIVLSAMEAEYRSLCFALGLEYDSTGAEKVKSLLEKYHPGLKR